MKLTVDIFEKFEEKEILIKCFTRQEEREFLAYIKDNSDYTINDEYPHEDCVYIIRTDSVQKGNVGSPIDDYSKGIKSSYYNNFILYNWKDITKNMLEELENNLDKLEEKINGKERNT